MKANEYIKKYGLVCANIKIAEIEHSKDFDGFYFDLKRLVESHELVEKHGGLEDAIKVCIQLHCKGEDTSKLKQAIFDVESCQ